MLLLLLLPSLPPVRLARAPLNGHLLPAAAAAAAAGLLSARPPAALLALLLLPLLLPVSKAAAPTGTGCGDSARGWLLPLLAAAAPLALACAAAAGAWRGFTFIHRPAVVWIVAPACVARRVASRWWGARGACRGAVTRRLVVRQRRHQRSTHARVHLWSWPPLACRA
jgi:hypothetical protein